MTVNWDDYLELFHKMNFEMAQMVKALERMEMSFKSLSNTYQEFIDYCEKNSVKKDER